MTSSVSGSVEGLDSNAWMTSQSAAILHPQRAAKEHLELDLIAGDGGILAGGHLEG